MSDTAVRRGGSEHPGDEPDTPLLRHECPRSNCQANSHLGGFRKPFNAASPFQLDEVLEDIVKFASHAYASD